MFGFPVQATKITTDAMNETVVAYNHNLTFNAANTDITDYYLPSSTESTREVMLMAVDTDGPQQGQVVSFTTADIPTLHKVESVAISKETKLIFVLAESTQSKGRPHHVYILNKPLAKELNQRTPS